MIKEDKKHIFLDSLDDLSTLKWMIFSNNGSNSNIYKYNKNILLKIFKEHLPFSEIKYFEDIKKLNINNVSLPQKFIIIDDKFYGYSMKFMPGKTLINLDDKVHYQDIVATLPNIQNTIERFSKNKYQMCDLNIYNVLYDEIKNTFNIVDIDLYLKENNMLYSEAYDFNALSFQSLLLTALTREFNYKRQEYKLYKKLKDILLFGTLNNNDYARNFTEIKNELEDNYSEEIKTLKDLRKVIKKNNN